MILSIDQGTSSTKCLIIDKNGQVVANVKSIITTNYLKNGFIEQDAIEIWQSVVNCLLQLKKYSKLIETVSISNQRESFLVWNKKTSLPLTPVISWQDRRSEKLINSLNPHALKIRQISGLDLDPMYSAGKLTWILKHLLKKQNIDRRNLAIGTIDSWLIWKFGGGHFIEIGNASRTQLFDITQGKWSDELLDLFELDKDYLPEIKPSNYAYSIKNDAEGISELKNCTINAVLGDSHSAFFAHRGWLAGNFKATYGTGTSIMGIDSNKKELEGISKTVAWQVQKDITLAHEANILSSGSTLTWLAKLFNMELSKFIDLAKNSKENVSLMPSFDGLGAPWWIKNSKASISNLSFQSTIADIAYAGLKSITFQVFEVINCLKKNDIQVDFLLADGEGSKNDYLMQLQADCLQIPVKSSTVPELSALGVAYLAGIELKFFNFEDLTNLPLEYKEFHPCEISTKLQDELNLWQNSLEKIISHE